MTTVISRQDVAFTGRMDIRAKSDAQVAGDNKESL
jgi:hypothetical protein